MQTLESVPGIRVYICIIHCMLDYKNDILILSFHVNKICRIHVRWIFFMYDVKWTFERPFKVHTSRPPGRILYYVFIIKFPNSIVWEILFHLHKYFSFWKCANQIPKASVYADAISEGEWRVGRVVVGETPGKQVHFTQRCQFLWCVWYGPLYLFWIKKNTVCTSNLNVMFCWEQLEGCVTSSGIL